MISAVKKSAIAAILLAAPVESVQAKANTESLAEVGRKGKVACSTLKKGGQDLTAEEKKCTNADHTFDGEKQIETETEEVGQDEANKAKCVFESSSFEAEHLDACVKACCSGASALSSTLAVAVVAAMVFLKE